MIDPTQTDQILAWLQDGGSLTDLEAFRLFGCRRLAARIRDIREEHGQSAVLSVPEGSGRRRWVRYEWAGEQLSLLGELR